MSLLLRIHYYQNKQLQVKESQYLILTYNWTISPIHNWTCNVVTISPFQCTAPSTWLTNWCTDPSTWLTCQLEKDVGYKVLQFIQTMKIKKLFGHKTQWCIDAVPSSRERWTRANCSQSQYACNNKCNNLMTALKIILIYVWDCEKIKPKQISWICVKKIFKNLIFVILDRYSYQAICQALHFKSRQIHLSSFNEQRFFTWFLGKFAWVQYLNLNSCSLKY